MKLVLNFAASVLMLWLMAILAWRGLAELGWLPPVLRKKKAAHTAEPDYTAALPPAGAPTAWQEYAAWAVSAVALEYAMIWLAWHAAGSPDAFGTYFWQRFTTAGDATHYLYLAEHGYVSAGERVNLIVFFPLYPILIRILKIFTGDFALSAVIISQACWAGAAVMLRRLAGRLAATAGTARCAVLSMILFPFSFFSMGIYTESLFLLLTLGALDAALVRDWRRGGILGLLAALCRTQGVLLLLPLVFAWLAAHSAKGEKRFSWQMLWLAGPLLGYGAYFWLNWLYCGSPTAFLPFQQAAPWYQSAQWVGSTIGQQWGMMADYAGLTRFIYLPQTVLYFAALALLLYAANHGAPEGILLYGGAYIGESYLSTWLISGSRYVFGCAALFLVVPYLKKPWMRYVLLGLEAAGCAIYFVYYMQGQAIM